MKIKVLNLLIVASLFISTSAFAQPGEKGQTRKQMTPEKRAMMMKKRQAMQKGERQMFFTEEQKEAIKAMRLETAKKVKPLKNELRELYARQKTLTTADNADLKAINKNIDEMSEVKAELAKIMAAQQQQMRVLLTDEQLLKFDAMKARAGKGKRGDIKRPARQRGGQPAFKRGA